MPLGGISLMNHRRLIWIVVAVVVLGLVASGSAWLGRRSALARTPASEARDRPAAAAVDQATVSAAGRDGPIHAAVPGAPLPPQDTPLRLVQAELTARARDGDAGAACRLAAELHRCEEVQRNLSNFDHEIEGRERFLDTIGDAAQRAQMRQQMGSGSLQTGERLLRDAASCEGITQLSLAERVGYWRQAALAGNRGALLQYASGNAFQWRSVMEVLPQLQVYRREAEGLALRAAAAGDLRAVLALAAAYTPDERGRPRSLLAQSVQPDPARALALYRYAETAMAAGDQALPRDVRERMFDRPRKALDGLLQSDDHQRADALAAQWQREWTAPSKPDRAQGGFIGPQGQVAYITPLDCGE
jgi:hypothetical protein